ncbi:hypothetical protein GUITHDRAFT_71319, partial [Guillardia theta CCMP2712]
MLYSLPGCSEQAWHADGEHLFASKDHPLLPLHCLNVFVPLVDIVSRGVRANGGTEFCLGSHRLTCGQEDIIWQSPQHKDTIGHLEPPAPLDCSAGSIVLFDYRVLHRGLANLSEHARPILYFTYARSWFQDVNNF